MEPFATTFMVHDDVVETAHLAAWIYPPQSTSVSHSAIWGFFLPGSTYSGKGYFDLQIQGFAEDSYSMARFLARNGIGVVTFDHLGTGASTSTVSGELLTWPGLFRELITGNDQQARQIDCPVYLSFGQEIDMCEYPRHEPKYYYASQDITCFLLPSAAHCANFSPHRHMLWMHLASWVHMHAKMTALT